jgi:hypothetical protein
MCCSIVGVSSNVLYYRRVKSKVLQTTMWLVFQTANSGKIGDTVKLMGHLV